MRFVESDYGGKQCWIIDEWSAHGFVHSFLGAAVDVRVDPTAFESLAVQGAPFTELQTLRQVHGTAVIEAEPRSGGVEGDAWFVDLEAEALSGIAFGIRTADCLPVILRARTAPFASGVHSGWRGSVDRIVSAAVQTFAARGVSPSDLEVAIGPGARGCCYEIGAELIPLFEGRFAEYQRRVGQPLESPLRQTAESIYVDNALLVRAELLSLGVPADRIAVFEGCTICDHRFFSFRREKELSGRQVSVIGRAGKSK